MFSLKLKRFLATSRYFSEIYLKKSLFLPQAQIQCSSIHNFSKNDKENKLTPKSERSSSNSKIKTVQSFEQNNDEEFMLHLKNDPDTFGNPRKKQIMHEADILEEKHFTEQVDPKQKLRTKQYADLIKAHIRKGKVKEAIDVLEQRMLKDDKVKPEAYIYNLLLGACGRVGYTKKAFMLYNEMKKRGLKAIAGTYTALFNACANSPWPETDGLTRAHNLHQIMIEKGEEPNQVHYNAMIKAFGRCGDLNTAFSLVDEMSNKKLEIKDDTINFLLQACITDKNAGFRHALLVWNKLNEKQIKPSVYSFNLMLRCVRDCGLGDVEVTKDVIQQLVRENPLQLSSIESSNELLTENINQTKPLIMNYNKLQTCIVEKCNKLVVSNERVTSDIAPNLEIVKHQNNKENHSAMRPNLLAPVPYLGNIISLNEVKKPEDRLVLVGGCGGFLDLMKDFKTTPDIKTFTQLLDCIPSTTSAEKQLIVIMKKSNVKPDIDFYNILIKKRSMRFDYEGAREILKSMQQLKYKPNLITYGVLALGCKTKEEALDLINEMQSSAYSLNAEILGAMLYQACHHENFSYILEIMELSLRENIQPNKKFMDHLQQFQFKCKRKLYSHSTSQFEYFPDSVSNMDQYTKQLFDKSEEMKNRIFDELKNTEDQVKETIKSVSDNLNEGAKALKSFLNPEPPNNKVIETRANVFTSREIYAREDGLVLYFPPKDNSDKNNGKLNFEIVLHRPTTETLSLIFSLFRSTNIVDAELKFTIFKDKIPKLVEISKEMCNSNGLQKICDILVEHPSWSLAHLAANFALYDSFNNPQINCYLNSSDAENGMSPLQVAITTQNFKTVQMLVSAKCSLEHLDNDGNTVFHYAASTTKDIISALAQGVSPQYISMRNKNGHTPLHIACLADKKECINALLLAGADVNKNATYSEHMEDKDIEPGYVGNFLQNNKQSVLDHQDMKNGGTPLHWAKSREVIEALIEENCNVNALNFEMKTALHVMVERNRLECVVALLSRQAKIDVGDKDGNRPIHLAVKSTFLPIMQALIVFGADLNVLNNAGVTPRHMMTQEQEPLLLYYLHAVGAKRCNSDATGCTDGCKHDGTFDGIPPPKVMGPTNRDILNQMLAVAGMEVASQKHKDGEFPNKGRLLALDGGGIKGLILVQMLLELESVFNKPINHCFDWLAGTSTGGILALAIASGKSMRECYCLYFRLKEVTFVGIRPYSSESLENILKDTFGTSTVMSDIKYPKVMVTGVLADRKPVELHLFRNYSSPSDILEVKHDSPYELPASPEEQFIWQVGRATGAAPTYFRAFGRFLDGGLIANNPTLDALTEIQEHTLALKAKGREDEACPVSVVCSLGTGVVPVTQLKSVDVYKPESIWDTTRIVMGLGTLTSLLVDQATSSDGRVVDRARAWCSYIGVPYFRFSPQLSEDINMDEKYDEKLVKMLWETKAYMYENMSVMRELSDLLHRK